MVNTKFLNHLIIPFLISCFLLLLTSCGGNHLNEFPDSDSVSLRFPELGSAQDENLTGDVRKLIGYAKEAEDISPSLALLNYKMAVRKYFNSSYGDCYAVYHIYEIEKLRSSPDHIINKLLYETIPQVKAKAFKTAKDDFIECLILVMTTSGNNPHEDVLKTLCDIANLIEKYGDPQKSDKFRKLIISTESVEDFCVSSNKSEGRTPIGRFIDIKNRKANEKIDLDSVMEELKQTPLKDRPYFMFVDISDACLKTGNEDYIKDILWMAYEFELSERKGSNFITIAQKTADHEYFQVLSDLIDKIDNPHYRSKVMEILLQGIYTNASIIQYKTIIEHLHDIALELNADQSYSMFNNRVWLDIALAYYKSGEKRKANEVMSGYGIKYNKTKASIITKALVEMGQKEKAIALLQSTEEEIGGPGISKDDVFRFTASVIAGYYMVDKADYADRLYNSIISEHSKMEPDITKRISNLLDLAHQCDLASEKAIADKVLKTTLSEIKKLDGKDFNWKLLYGAKFNALADYDTAFDIANFFNKDNKTYDDPCQEMVNGLIREGKYERAAQKAGYIRIEQYRNQTLMGIADKYIDEGKYEEALKITELMAGDSSGWGSTVTKRKVAVELARMGDLKKALDLVICNAKNYFDSGCMQDLQTAQIYVAYADSVKISKEEQQQLIDLLIPLIMDKNYSMSLDDDYRVRQIEDLELPRKAESDLVQCAYYMSDVYISWRPINAEMKIDIARVLIELGRIDDGIKALDRALEICEKFDYDSPENYLPVKKSIADQFNRIGHKQKAIDILNQIVQSGLAGKLRDEEIIDIAKAFRDIDSRKRADNFIDGIKIDNQNGFRENLDEAKKLIRALWLVENDELSEMLSYKSNIIPNDSRLIYSIISAALEKGQYDVCLKLSDRLDSPYSKYDAFSQLIENIEKITNLGLVKEIIAKMEKLMPELDRGYREIATHFHLARAYGRLNDEVKKETHIRQALKLVDELPKGEKDLRLLQEIVSLLKKSELEEKAEDLQVEIKNRYPEVNKYAKIEQMLELARQGKFQEAIDFLNNIGCLDNPSDTIADLAKIMTDKNEYELAMSTIEWCARSNDRLECPRQGDRFQRANPFDPFSDIFINAGRIDLAIRLVKHMSFEKQTLALMNMEKKKLELGYTLTDEDRKNMRNLIHRDPLYIEALDKSI